MDEEEYGTCPYNSAHRIVLFRLSSHIVKCRRNYHGPPLVQCAYNANHLVKFEDLNAHEAVCYNRLRFQQAELARISDKFRAA